MIAAIIISIIAYTSMMYDLINWYLDAILVTTSSLLIVEWHGLFHNESTRVSYESVESISLEVKGFSALTLGYGDISIERDAAPSLEMSYMSSPKKLELEILKGKEEYDDKNTFENTEALSGILSQLVAQHIKKHGWKKR